MAPVCRVQRGHINRWTSIISELILCCRNAEFRTHAYSHAIREDVPAYTRPPTAMSTAHSVDYLTASGRDHAPCRPQSMWMHQIRLGNEIPPIHLHICGGALSGMVIEKRRYGRRRLYATTTTMTMTITSTCGELVRGRRTDPEPVGEPIQRSANL